VTPDPVWHFAARSQSAAWTALNGPYRDAVLDDRSDEAAEIMATEIAPDFEYVGPRCQRALSPTDGGGVNLLEFEHDGEIWCSNGNLEEVSDPRRIDWLAWVEPAPDPRVGYGVREPFFGVSRNALLAEIGTP
jgi:hypothetical protein